MDDAVGHPDIEQVHRDEWARVVATVARSTGDLDLAEDAAAEAFATALERWPTDGYPDNPGAWLVTTARNRATDRLRREAGRDLKQTAAQHLLAGRAEPEPDPTPNGPEALRDDVLRLVFTCCHPALAPEHRIALTLRLVAGLSTAEVARAFFVPEATMAQRLVRAKAKIRRAAIPYRVPAPADLPERITGVLRVVYLVFREGYAPSGGDAVVRPETCDEAIRLARLLHDLLPEEPETQSLLALLLLQHSRRDARVDDGGRIVLLELQDRSRWDHRAITEGAVRAARALRARRGPYALQAAIAACHATAPSADQVDWRTIVTLYDQLARIDPSPAVTVSRAIAVGRVHGPDAALAMLDSLLATPEGEAMARSSHHPHLARADLLRRAGDTEGAAVAYRRALLMAPTQPERDLLARHLDDLAQG